VAKVFISPARSQARGFTYGTIQGSRCEAPQQEGLHELLREERRQGDPLQEVQLHSTSLEGEGEQEGVSLPKPFFSSSIWNYVLQAFFLMAETPSLSLAWLVPRVDCLTDTILSAEPIKLILWWIDGQ
jgi:hypothetical protein